MEIQREIPDKDRGFQRDDWRLYLLDLFFVCGIKVFSFPNHSPLYPPKNNTDLCGICEVRVKSDFPLCQSYTVIRVRFHSEEKLSQGLYYTGKEHKEEYSNEN